VITGWLVNCDAVASSYCVDENGMMLQIYNIGRYMQFRYGTGCPTSYQVRWTFLHFMKYFMDPFYVCTSVQQDKALVLSFSLSLSLSL
jgi:hypothetical protein